jgi:glutaredoxin
MLIVAALAVAGCKPQQGTKAAAKSPTAVKVEFFVMSQCPYGVQVVNAVQEVVDKLGPDIDFQLNYIGRADANGQMTSMHGPNEVTGDIVQLCAAKYAPADFLKMVVCQNKSYKDIATNWESCAKEAKLPVEKISACVKGDEGKGLLKASFALSDQKNARGSPTIFVDGKPYSGRRSPVDFMRAICAANKAPTKPAACQAIPEPPKVNVTVLGDKRCTDCRTEQLVNMLKFRIGNPVLKELDYSDAEGKALYDQIGGGKLPLVLFDATLDADKEASAMFGRRLAPAGTSSMRAFPTGGSWDPACANEGGCSLEQCKGTLACRPETAKKLELFVMSMCPYGVRALNAMEEVLKNFDNKIDFELHFIGNGTAAAGFQSMHGQPEVDEDLREVCAIKNYKKNYKFMEYVACRNKDLKADWKECTGKNGIDAKVMTKCSEGDEGKKLLEADLQIANGLGIGASPTWIANGKNKFSGIDAETIRRNVCEHNKDLKGCENKLSGPSVGAPVQGGCGK